MTHGHARQGRKSPEYVAWRGMIQRCEDPNSQQFHNYGGRGIRVCRRWRESFEAFLADVGPRPSPKHSLDRFPNNDGHYGPGNVRWATAKQQRRNTRQNRMILYRGRKFALTELAELHGLRFHQLCYRLNAGWSVERALMTPVKRYCRRACA